jgi:hypothetical protein
MISSDLRDRLDAAREELDVDIQWFERGDPRCCGRDFGFWHICVGPYGWRDTAVRQAEWARTHLSYGRVNPELVNAPHHCIAEGWDLSRCLEMALHTAEQQRRCFYTNA